MAGWLALAYWLWLAGWHWLAGSGWLTLAGWLWLAGWLTLASWLVGSLIDSLSGWLAGWLPARPTTYMPASLLTSCLLITSQTLWVHLVYGFLIVVIPNALETRTRWKRVKTLGQHQVGVNFQSCITSTMNFHMGHFSWIPQNNASLMLSCKFGESKCNSYYDITLTASHGTNHTHALNEHLDFSQHGPYTTPSEVILWYSYSASFKNKTEILIDLLH